MSAILSADDLNDFISPGVACIKPVETLPAAAEPPPSDLAYEVVIDGTTAAAAATAGAPAQISLTDCLACSGCVTSAEAVLVSLQSHSELLSVLDRAPGLRITRDGGAVGVEGLENPDSKLFVASVSPQTRAGLAAVAGRGVGERDAGGMITQALAGRDGLRAGGRWNNAFTWVVDTNAAREACLVLGAEEATADHTKVAKPILTSSCPGWVCYAEKTHPYVLPHISKIKSPQALMGTLLKTTLSRTLGISPDRIWHLAVMPCFDKKLEASREELTDSVWNRNGQPGRGVRDVDCVITSKEILMLMESRGIDFFSLPKESIPHSSRIPFPDPTIREFIFPSRQRDRQVPTAGTSGGNLYYTLQYVASRHPGSRIETTRGRNADVAEFSVISESGDSIFKAARYYGFRNIQNLVRKLKPARPSRMPGTRAVGVTKKATGKPAGVEYNYVEVMACPGGCTNGGGQVKVDDPIVIERRGADFQQGPDGQRQWLAEMDEAYFSADENELSRGKDTEKTEGYKDDLIGDISPKYIWDKLAHWSSITGIDIDRLVSTSYREVISDVGKSKTNDTERVIQLASKIGGGW
ncbi:putative cytosolic Fe-S cluster assembly factor nar-1 [Rosellinia necatrix]|uniref:Cytosolic Fe-S cluster assembly factor NAR1 n=1 Tax=Rosellinia necatrix TaxID=77044 RepID=A0A1W2TBF2_ROSNE|nr:putative cytosolic Fe-S cluster assembly factor nar-1 [Rosellinia necatrix]